MHLACGSTLVLDCKPLVYAFADTQRRQLELTLADSIVRADILIQNREGNVVANVLHIDVECLVPDGGLSATVLCLGPELGLAGLNFHVRVHLAKGFRIAC